MVPGHQSEDLGLNPSFNMLSGNREHFSLICLSLSFFICNNGGNVVSHYQGYGLEVRCCCMLSVWHSA